MFKRRKLCCQIMGAVVGFSSLLACDAGSVRRRLELEVAAGELPHAQTTVLGRKLRVDVHGMEPLRSGLLLSAWSRSADGWARLGPFAGASSASFEGDWADTEEIALSPEGAESSTVTPELPIYFRGAPGDALEFFAVASAKSQAFQGAQATVAIEDETIELTHEGLPLLSEGASYAVWLVAGSGGEHKHSGGSEDVEAASLGTLGSTGSEIFTTHLEIPQMKAVMITMELDDGAETMAEEMLIMQGMVPTSASATPKGEVKEVEHNH